MFGQNRSNKEDHLFTGIIESQSQVIQVLEGQESLQIVVEKPNFFDDLKIGDSIACNGVCLTLEEYDSHKMVFTIGYETLQITDWNKTELQKRPLNLERSLRFGDRIHGHLVSGHVDTRVALVEKQMMGDCLLLNFEVPQKHQAEIWKKSSVTLDGVSLTINEINEKSFQVCLVPETLRKTNLQKLLPGDTVNFESDYYMKGFLKSQEVRNA